MHPLHPLSLLGSLLAIVCILAWIGWHFFLAAPDPGRTPLRSLLARLQTFRSRLPAVPPTRLRFTLATWRPDLSMRSLIKGRTVIFLGVPLVLATLTISLVVHLSRRVELAPLEGLPLAHEDQVRTQLNPEHLVPPPPLPPSFFVSQDRPDLTSADRDWTRLDPAFAQRVLELFAHLKQAGYTPVLLEGYRSPQRQDMLAAQGSRVTHAKGMQSRHQYGLAADIAFSRDGRLVISEKDPWAAAGYKALGEAAEALGLKWGGRWTLGDFGHVESPHRIPRACPS